MANMEITNENEKVEFENENAINFTQIFNSVIRNSQITPEDFRVYAVICSYTWGSGSWNLTIESLIEETGVKRTTLFACLNWLEQSGYMQRVERRNDKNERLPNKYIVKRINQDTGLPIGVNKIEKRKAAPKGKKTNTSNCGKDCSEVVDNIVDNLNSSTSQSSAGELGVVQQANLGSSAGELGVVQQANRLNTITKPNTIVIKDHSKKDDSATPLPHFEVWLKSKEIIKKELTEVEFNTWIEPLVAVSTTGDTLKLSAPNRFTLEIIQARYSAVVMKCIKVLGLSFNEIDIVVASTN